MQFWRAATFEALKRAASSAAERWPAYSTFAAFQEQGLRKRALEVIRPFSQELASRDLSSRWDFVSWLFAQVQDQGHVVLEALVPYPLKVAVVLPTLHEARNASEPRVEAYLWMSRHFFNDIAGERPNEDDPHGSLLREGLRRTSSDRRLQRALAMHLLAGVEFNGHHLLESRYLGDPKEDLRILVEARELLDDQNDPLRPEIDRAEELVLAWEAYRASSRTDFAAWCSEHGIQPPGGTAVYYGR